MLSCSVHGVPRERNTSWALCKPSLRDPAQSRASVCSSCPALDSTPWSSWASVSSSVETHCTETRPATFTMSSCCCLLLQMTRVQVRFTPVNKPLSAAARAGRLHWHRRVSARGQRSEHPDRGRRSTPPCKAPRCYLSVKPPWRCFSGEVETTSVQH